MFYGTLRLDLPEYVVHHGWCTPRHLGRSCSIRMHVLRTYVQHQTAVNNWLLALLSHVWMEGLPPLNLHMVPQTPIYPITQQICCCSTEVTWLCLRAQVWTNFKFRLCRQKDFYDHKVHRQHYEQDVLVWPHSSTVTKGQFCKLHHSWMGPHCIVKQLSDVTYHIQHTQRRKNHLVVHFNQLKQCMASAWPRDEEHQPPPPIANSPTRSSWPHRLLATTWKSLMLMTWLLPLPKDGTPQERTIHQIGIVFQYGTESGTDSFSEEGCVTLVMEILVLCAWAWMCKYVLCVSTSCV